MKKFTPVKLNKGKNPIKQDIKKLSENMTNNVRTANKNSFDNVLKGGFPSTKYIKPSGWKK